MADASTTEPEAARDQLADRLFGGFDDGEVLPIENDFRRFYRVH